MSSSATPRSATATSTFSSLSLIARTTVLLASHSDTNDESPHPFLLSFSSSYFRRTSLSPVLHPLQRAFCHRLPSHPSLHRIPSVTTHHHPFLFHSQAPQTPVAPIPLHCLEQPEQGAAPVSSNPPSFPVSLLRSLSATAIEVAPLPGCRFCPGQFSHHYPFPFCSVHFLFPRI
ncbi:uncharacterized protein LOC107640555 isoform X2 [Arachis ipaensis]|uniref:uncharacterized protein LOC107640555 isoform X2 n=1 Tax=Arachis ipaensis TaxID=130454 RepID=UPI000A2B0C1A|nr:uncharacterized protein LOC107640555 isoform X2 [Arachis ipaensis]